MRAGISASGAMNKKRLAGCATNTGPVKPSQTTVVSKADLSRMKALVKSVKEESTSPSRDTRDTRERQLSARNHQTQASYEERRHHATVASDARSSKSVPRPAIKGSKSGPASAMVYEPMRVKRQEASRPNAIQQVK